jgi:hypothetical protein
MTRTARAAFPRALVKDRSESRSGHRDDKHVRKDGAGPHGWGSFADEKALEEAALHDEKLEFDDYDMPDGESVVLYALHVTQRTSGNIQRSMEL